MIQQTIKAIVDEDHRLVLPPEVAQHYQPGQEIEVSLISTADNPFLKAIGSLPPLPGGNLQYMRDLKGHSE